MWPFKYPYTNFHELNLDWIIEQTQKNSYDITQLKNEATPPTSPKTYVDIRDFGCIPDARYYDIHTRKWYSDYPFATEATDNASNFHKALNYMRANNIDTLYIAGGNYWVPFYTFSVDTSKERILGDGHSGLCSSGIGANPFITLTSPLSHIQYNNPRVPISNIAIMGNYFNDDGASIGTGYSTGIAYGPYINPDNSLVPCHMALYNVVITGFNNGLFWGTAYKSALYNVSVIACDAGVYSTSTASVVPVTAVGCYFECCHTALYLESSGYNSVTFSGGAFEYNRQIANTKNMLIFQGVRFEYDSLSACGPDKTPMAVFTSEASDIPQRFIQCNFLDLPHFAANTSAWIANPYVLDSPSSLPVIYAGILCMYDCSIATQTNPSGNFYCNTAKAFCYNIINKGVTSMFNESVLQDIKKGAVSVP